MKPSEAVGLIRFNRRFGRSRIVSYEGGKMFKCRSLDVYPGVEYTTGWCNLRKM